MGPNTMRSKVVFVHNEKEIWVIGNRIAASLFDIPPKETFVNLPQEVVGKGQKTRFWVRKIETTYNQPEASRIWSEVKITLEDGQ